MLLQQTFGDGDIRFCPRQEKICGCSALSVPEVSIIPLSRLEEKKRRFLSFFFDGRREGFDHVMFMGELTLLYGVVGVGEGPR